MRYLKRKIQQYKNEQQRLNNVNVNIDELLNNSKIDANKRKYEQIFDLHQRNNEALRKCA